MLYNELSLIKKRLDNPTGLIQYHIYSLHSGAGKPAKFKTKFCYRVIVDSEFNMKIDPEQYIDENVLLDSYSVQYKSCPQDTSMNRIYYFGDISMSMHPSKKVPKASFDKFSNNLKTPIANGFNVPSYLSRFKDSVSQDNFIKSLWDFMCEKMIEISGTEEGKKLTDIYIHFDLSEPINVSNWYEIPGCIELMDNMYISTIKNSALQYSKEMNLYSFKKSLLPMVASGDKTNDVQFPGFDLKNRHKSFGLPFNEIRYVLYHAKIMKALTVPLLKTKPYVFEIVPSGSYTTEDLIVFMDRINSLRLDMFKKSEGKVTDELEVAEEGISTTFNQEDFLGDPATFFNQTISGGSKNMTSFDIILVRDDGNVMVNVSEINNISRSSLLKNLKHINECAIVIRDKYKISRKPTLVGSFYSIHKSIKKGEKYQQKYIKFLFAAIRGLYYGDPNLVHIYLDNIYRNIRTEEENDNFFMKIAYEFIESLNVKGPSMPQEQSSKLGELCAVLACPITFIFKSFLKAEIGQFDRRIRTLRDVEAFATNTMDKINRHEGEAYGSKGVIIPDSFSYNITKIREIIKGMNENSIPFDPISFKLGFQDRLGRERFFSKKPKE